MKSQVAVEIIDAGMYLGTKLITVQKLMSWKRRGLIVRWERGCKPVAEVNNFKLNIIWSAK